MTNLINLFTTTEGNEYIMRISLIHGEDTRNAYNAYRELIDSSKKKGFDIILISDVKNIVTQSLFEDRVVFTLNKPNKIKPNDWKWLSQNASKYNSNLIIYYEGNAPVTITKNLPKDTLFKKFDLPRIIFNFLDSVYPGNAKRSLQILDELVKSEPIELVLFFLGRHVRDLAWVSNGSETLNVPSWRVSKFAQQAGKFEPDGLRKLISELASLDVKSKTSDLDLRSSLDILLIKYLK